MKKIAGYQNTTLRKIVIFITNLFANILFLKKNSEYSNEFFQLLNKYLKKKLFSMVKK